jgi:cytidine deaminase
MNNKIEFESLYKKAFEAAKKSYSPYSCFPVGAALLLKDGNIITGTNIENRSFGLTNCAERSAIFTAVSQGFTEFVALAIAAPKSSYPVAPCGACRQVISEFAASDMPIIFGPDYSKTIIKTLGELYPDDSLHDLKQNQ